MLSSVLSRLCPTPSDSEHPPQLVRVHHFIDFNAFFELDYEIVEETLDQFSLELDFSSLLESVYDQFMFFT